MSTMIRLGSDGWRSRCDEDFTEENVVRVTAAAASLWSQRAPGSVVYIGYDARDNAAEFGRLVGRVIAGFGLAAKVAASCVPIPALSWTVAHDACAVGGIMITGSHHPFGYLGIKFRLKDGGVASEEFDRDLTEAIEAEPSERRGAIELVDIATPYFQALTRYVDAESIRRAGLSVVYDPMYGSGGAVMTDALRSIGVRVHEIHPCGACGSDVIRPEPVEPWADECEQAVVDAGAHMGLISDGDADRIAAVDERGRYIDSNKIISLVLAHLVQNRGQTGRVVLGLSSSMQTQRTARALGCRVTVKPIGFTYIYEEMRKGGVLIGGEETGGICIPDHLAERDGLLVGLLLCELLAQTSETLGNLVDQLDEHLGAISYGRKDVRLPNESCEFLRTILPGLNPQEVAGRRPVAVSHMDGLRLAFEDESWLLIRPSGTEQLVRIYAEARTVEMRDALLDAGTALAGSSSPA